MRPNWVFMKLPNSKVMGMKGYRTRAYRLTRVGSVNLGRPGRKRAIPDRSRTFLGAVVHSGPTDILIEVIFKVGDLGEWRLASGEVISTFFSELNTPIRSHFQETAKVTGAEVRVVEDGSSTPRTCVRIDPQHPFNPHQPQSLGMKMGMRVGNIQYTILGDMLEDYGDWLSLMLMFPKTVKHVEDAKDLRQAMLNISRSGPSIWSKYFENEKERMVKKLDKYRSALETNETEFIRTCEEAASALEELNGRFGIEIDMSLEDGVREEDD